MHHVSARARVRARVAAPTLLTGARPGARQQAGARAHAQRGPPARDLSRRGLLLVLLALAQVLGGYADDQQRRGRRRGAAGGAGCGSGRGCRRRRLRGRDCLRPGRGWRRGVWRGVWRGAGICSRVCCRQAGSRVRARQKPHGPQLPGLVPASAARTAWLHALQHTFHTQAHRVQRRRTSVSRARQNTPALWTSLQA